MPTNSPGFRRLPRIADQMTPDLDRCVRNGSAAERAGDFVEALEWHRAIPMFQRSRHRVMLEQLIAAGDDLPAWVWLRWATYLATRCEDGWTGRTLAEIRGVVAGRLHVDLFERCYLAAGDPIKVQARVCGESWALHQVTLTAALDAFIGEHAGARIQKHGWLAEDWQAALVGAYRVDRSSPGAGLRVIDLATDNCHEVLDLGAWVGNGEGWVLGRLVPSSRGGPLMFDTAPLPVPEEVAADVGSGTFWLGALDNGLELGVLDSEDLLFEDYELLTDVRALDLLCVATPAPDRERVLMQLGEGRDEIGRAAFRLLDRAVCDRSEGLDAADQALVSAAVLQPSAFADARRRLARPGSADRWRFWADLAHEPARSRLGELAEVAGGAAA